MICSYAQEILLTQCLPIIEAAMEQDTISDPTPEGSLQGTDVPPAKRPKHLAAIISHFLDNTPSCCLRSSITPREKLENDISSSAAPDTDILAWWKSKQGHFPTLAHMARMYLCICKTRVPSERLFSTARHLADKSRVPLASQKCQHAHFFS